MNDDRPERPVPPALRGEALDLVIRFRSGEAAHRDTAELMQWRARSPLHARALSEAIRLRRSLAAQGRSMPWPDLTAIEGRRAAGGGARAEARAPIGRRTFIGAATAAGVIAAGGTMFGILPSIDELGADYRTGTGERRAIALGRGASLDLNTRTSVAIDHGPERIRVRLIAGEVAMVADHPTIPVFVYTIDAVTRAERGRFGVRLGAGTCVTCLAGQVRVAVAAAPPRVLGAGQQVIASAGALQPTADVDPAQVLAWRKGELIFSNRPLAEVVREINRYRGGHIILASGRLGAIPVNAVFQLDRLDHAVSQIREVAAARQTDLPGGIVVLS